MDKYKRAIETLKILKKEYHKYRKPLSTSVQKRTKDPFKVLIATILSARARDTQTEKISYELFKIAATPKKLAKLKTKKLQKIIKSIGFYKEKSKRIKQAAQHLLDNHKGKVPRTREELIKVPGVGRKTANVFLAEVYEEPTIGVDVHCTTISNRLGFVKTRNPLKIEKALEEIFPKKEWRNINRALVSHGQNICTSISPKCSICPIEHLCPKIGVKNHR